MMALITSDCGTGVWTISNRYFPGATHYSPTAIATARKVFGYNGTGDDLPPYCLSLAFRSFPLAKC